MNLNDNVRVLVDWNNDGVFSLPGEDGQGDLPNLLTDPVQMASAKHEAINGAWLHRTNWIQQADRWDAYEYRTVAGDAPTIALRRDGDRDSKQILSVTLREGLTSGAFTLMSTFGGGNTGQVPKPSDALSTISPVVNLDLAAGTYRLRVAVRAVHANTVGETLTVAVRDSGGSTMGGGAATATVLTTDWQFITFSFTLASTLTDGHVFFNFSPALSEDFQIYEITDLGVYLNAEVDFTSLADFISQSRNQQGVYPVIIDLTKELGDFASAYVHLHTGTNVFGGYRVTYGIDSFPDLEPLQTYTAMLWIKHTGSVTTSTDFILRSFFRQTDSVHSVLEWTSSPVTITNSTEWQRIYVTFVTPPDLDTLDFGVELVKNNTATGREIAITGWMLVRHGDSRLTSNLLPDAEDIYLWDWTNKSSQFGMRTDSTSLPHAAKVLQVVSDADLPKPASHAVTVQALTIPGDRFPSKVVVNNYYLASFYDYNAGAVEVGTTDPQAPEFNVVNNGSPDVAVGEAYEHDRAFKTWARRQMVFRAGHGSPAGDNTAVGFVNAARAIGSQVTLPGVYLLPSINKFPYPNTAVTVTNNGGATSTKTAGKSGSYFNLVMTIAGGQSVIIGNAGEIPVNASERYLLMFEAEGNTGYTFDILDQSSNIIKTVTASNYILQTGAFFHRIIVDFVTGAGDTSVRLRFNPTMTSETVANFWVIAYDDVAGGGVAANLPTVWNAGIDLPGLDDITPYVTAIQTNNGKTDFDTAIALEGEAELSLNNDSRYFSPANTASPFYGFLVENLKVQIQYKDNTDTWQPLWSGWTHKFELEAGRSRSRTAKLTARQGIFRLQEGEFIPGTYEDVKVSELVPKLIAGSGWFSLNTSFGSFVESAQLGYNSILRDNSALFSVIDEGIYTLDFVGDKWNRSTSMYEALEDVLLTENAQLWLTRSGTFVLRNREFFINRNNNFDDAVNLDLEADSVDYTFGHNIVNRVEVKVTAKEEVTDAIIWESQGTIELKASQQNVESSKTFELDFSFEEGGPRTITRVAGLGDGSTITAYITRNKKRLSVFDPMPAEDVKKYITMTVIDLPDGGKNVVFSNKFRSTVYIHITLRGDYIRGGETETYVFEDTDSIETLKAVYKKTIDAKAITTEEEAQNIAQYILLREALPYPEFPAMEVTPVDIDEKYKILGWNVGTVLSLSETQTLENNLPHIILQENFDIRPGVITAKYKLAALDMREYLTVGETAPTGTIIYL